MTAIDDLNAAAAAINAAATRFQQLGNDLAARYAPLAGDFAFQGPIHFDGIMSGGRVLNSSGAMTTEDFGAVIGLAGTMSNQALQLVGNGEGEVAIISWAENPWRLVVSNGLITYASYSWSEYITLKKGESVVLRRFGSTWFIIGGTLAGASQLIDFATTTTQGFAANALTRITTIASESNTDASSNGSLITINRGGRYLVTVASEVKVDTWGAGNYAAACAIYWNDNSASNINNQMIVADDWNYTAGPMSNIGHELQQAQQREFAAGDQLSLWGNVFGANISAASMSGAYITLMRVG